MMGRMQARHCRRMLLLLILHSAIAHGETALSPSRLYANVDQIDRQRSKQTLVVLPFRNFSGDSADDWVSWGLAIGLRDALAVDRDSFVVRPAVVFDRLAEDQVPAKDYFDERVGQRLAAGVRADWYMVGSFHRIGVGISYRIRLLRTADRLDVAAFRGDEQFDHRTLEAMAQIADTIHQKLKIKIDRKERSLRNLLAVQTVLFAAYEAFSRGMIARFEGTSSAMEAAKIWFERAMEKDYRYRNARAALSETYMIWGLLSKGDNRDYQALYRQASETEKNVAGSTGFISPGTFRVVDQLIDADRHYLIAQAQISRSQFNKAIDSLEDTVDLCPFDKRALLLLGFLYQQVKDLDRAHHAFRQALLVDPEFTEAAIAMEKLIRTTNRSGDIDRRETEGVNR